MRARVRHLVPAVLAAVLLPVITACDSTDDERLPAYPVQIMLNNPGLWQTYGVAAFGESRNFIRQTREPANFQYLESTYTGFGGVLLIMGMDPFTSGDMIPLAYDLACPVERKESVRVYVDADTFDAVCPLCGSHYDVTMGGGSPTAGPALTGTVKYALQRYSTYPSGGGYVIVR